MLKISRSAWNHGIITCTWYLFKYFQRPIKIRISSRFLRCLLLLSVDTVDHCHMSFSKGQLLLEHVDCTMSECPSCSKILSSDQSLRQHYLGKHGGHLCVDCDRTFRSSHALNQHVYSKHSSLQTFAYGADDHSHSDPFPGIEGYWTERENYSGQKSFGHFNCSNCSNKWYSAHAFKHYKQGCQECEKMSFPCCLWVNNGDRKERSEDSDKDDGPHDRARCEACRRGVCRVRVSHDFY